MGTLIVYIIKCTFCLTFFYLFNRLLLSGETFHKINRWVWLILIPLSLMLPLCQFTIWELFEGKQVVVPEGTGFDFSNFQIESVAEDPNDPNDPNDLNVYDAVKILLCIYFAGVTFFACRMFYAYTRLFGMILSEKRVVNGEASSSMTNLLALLEDHKRAVGIERKVQLIVQKKGMIPFSWMNYIFIGEDDLKENGTEILRHELSHIKNGHSYDVLFADLFILFQWFNPAAWLLKRALQQVHEFQADESVILSGVNAKKYQLLLIKKAVGQRLFSMANSFNHSKLKNRINMMLKERSNKWAYAKYLYTVPLALAVVSAYAAPDVSSKLHVIESSTVKSSQIQQVDDTLTTTMGEILVVRRTGNKEQDVAKKQKDTTVIVRSREKESSVILKMTGTEKDSILYIVDGVIVNNCSKMDPKSIKNISVLQSTTAMQLYGEAAKNGAVIISTFGNAGTAVTNRSSTDTIAAGGVAQNNSSLISDRKVLGPFYIKTDSLGTNGLMVRGAEENLPLYILDDKEINGLENVNQADIQSITVLKNKTATEIYGDKGKNGVIVIVTKGINVEKTLDK